MTKKHSTPPWKYESPFFELGKCDPVMRNLVEAFGPLKLRPHRGSTAFGALSRMIVGQQLSSKAAATIFGRFEQLIPCQDIHNCQFIANLELLELRSAGLSSAKAKYIRELARATCEGRLPDLKQFRKMSETAVRELLLQFKGIGSWTVEMFEIFVLGKPDILSLHDAGLRRGFELAYGIDPGGSGGLKKYAKIWSPHCSTASLYLWKVTDNPNALKRLAGSRFAA